jgi:hypothetical protein
MHNRLAMHRLVPLILWVHGNCHITQHCLNTRCGHNNLPIAPFKGVSKGYKRPELYWLVIARHAYQGGLLKLDFIHFYVRDSSAKLAAPVDEAICAKDQPILHGREM